MKNRQKKGKMKPFCHLKAKFLLYVAYPLKLKNRGTLGFPELKKQKDSLLFWRYTMMTTIDYSLN